MAKDDYVPQHHKLAVTGELGQDLSASRMGATGKPSNEQSKSSLIDGKSSGDANTLSGKKNNARSPW